MWASNNFAVKCKKNNFFLKFEMQYTIHNKLIINIVGLLLFAAFSQSATAQEIEPPTNEQEKMWITGVAQTINGDTLPHVTIIITNNRRGIINRSGGLFHFKTELNDTLIFSHIGFKALTMFVDTIITKQLKFNVVLEADTVLLSEVKVFPWMVSYAEFKKAVIEYEPEEKKKRMEIEDVVYLPPHVVDGRLGVTFDGPISAIYNAFSKRGKSIRKYQELVKRDEILKRQELKYNKQIVAEITGIEEDAKIYEFMKYCNFSDEFIEHSTDYEIYLVINNFFAKYKKEIAKINAD